MKAWCAVVSLVVVLFASPAAADEVAPSLEGPDLRVRADAVLRGLVTAKPDAKLRGLYAAFDPSASDPIAQVACDDDGDYVIVLSDAMLRLAAYIARLSPERAGDYAAFLARTQVPGRRLLPPAAGTFDGTTPPDESDRWSALVSFLYARELAHLRAGDLVCPNPTTTKEKGDDVWSSSEQHAAEATAVKVYPGLAATRDASAVAELGTNVGALMLTAFFARFEAEHGRFGPSYLTTHPRSAAREAALGTQP